MTQSFEMVEIAYGEAWIELLCLPSLRNWGTPEHCRIYVRCVFLKCSVEISTLNMETWSGGTFFD